jgi:hypothetical protein
MMCAISALLIPRPAPVGQHKNIRQIGKGGLVGNHAGKTHLLPGHVTPKHSDPSSERSKISRGKPAAQ